MSATARQAPPNRDPRWERTRRALIEAGRQVLARKGVEAATVLEIVREAGVSQPSFYNHFASRDELVQAIAADLFEADIEYKVQAFRRIADPAEAIAHNAMHTLRLARRDPAVAWVMVRSGAMRDLRRTRGADDLVKMIEAGVRSARFQVDNAAVAAAVIRGAAYPLLQDILQDAAPADVEAQFAELVLRMLGLSRREAAVVAARAVPAQAPPPGEITRQSKRRTTS
jgi:AcrR family transcriptional regulator